MVRPLRVLLGVSGGIAAYKAVEIVRSLRRGGHEVRCVLSRNAASFVAPLTLEVLSGHPVYSDDYLRATGSTDEPHISAAKWGDLLCVAPATANTLAGLALGLAGDFLGTTALAFGGRLVLAPAMHPEMWGKEIVQRHVATLVARGAEIVGPAVGELASGEVGIGRMAEPDEIVAVIEEGAAAGPLAGRTVLITAGPTREAIDPVRFLSNRSSGKMGFALAAEAANQGARTVLVAGPVSLPTPRGVDRIDVETAAEMSHTVHRHSEAADLIIMAAAVSDYRMRDVATQKLKKRDGIPLLDLERNPDILAEVASSPNRAVVVGFAAETGNLEIEGPRKLVEKGLDVLIANDVSRDDIGFDSEHNEVVVFRPGVEPLQFPRRDKRLLAVDLLEILAQAVREREDETVASHG